MKIVGFEKWFFDLVTPEEDYIIFFHTFTKLLAFRISFLEIHHVRNAHQESVEKSFSRNSNLEIKSRHGHSVLTDRGEILVNSVECNIDLKLDDVRLQLKIDPVPAPGRTWPELTIRSSRRQFLRWRPLFLKGLFTGEIITDEKLRVEGCKGYADYLISQYWPPRVPVRTLYWGRLHHDRLDLTFTFAENEKKGRKWCTMIIHMDDEVICFNEISMEIASWDSSESLGIRFPRNYSMTAQSGDEQVKMKIEQDRPAIESIFLDSPKIPGFLSKKILKLLAKDPRGIKFFSRAWIRLQLRGQVITLKDEFMITEYVVFK